MSIFKVNIDTVNIINKGKSRMTDFIVTALLCFVVITYCMCKNTTSDDTINIEKVEVNNNTYNTFNNIALPPMDEATLIRVLQALPNAQLAPPKD
jgi:hypothetical protein